jgi:hypothetical protein
VDEAPHPDHFGADLLDLAVEFGGGFFVDSGCVEGPATDRKQYK